MNRIAKVFVAWLLLSAAVVARAENWERFRGPNGAGQGEAAAVPSEWTEANYLWQRELPGVGHSSPVVWGERLFITSADPNTGEQHWRNRVGGHFHSSPVRVGDRIFGLSKNGDVVVLAAGKEFQLLSQSSLGDTCQATPAVANGRIYFRTESSLVCLGDAAGG